jgi:peptidoglycan/LPS O-acetylase OafA/YrhL
VKQRVLLSIVIVLALLTEGARLLQVDNTIQATADFAFLMICPGLLIVQLLQVRDLLFQSLLIVACGIALVGAVVTVAQYAGLWQPDGIMSVIILVTLAVAAGNLALDVVLSSLRRDKASSPTTLHPK